MKRALLFAIIFALTGHAAADSKIKTRTQVAGHSTENTAFIKGARERSEISMGMAGMNLVTITQCDQKRLITVNPRAKTCMVAAIDTDAATPAPAASAPAGKTRKGGVVTITTAFTDTGERQKMLGLTARRLKSTMSIEAGPGACTPANMRMETDGWYADIAPALSCQLGRPPQMHSGGRPDCEDTYRFKRTGAAQPGYPLKQTMTMNSGGQTFTTTTEVVELTTTPLDAALFDMPPGCRMVSSYQELMGMPSMADLLKGAPPAAVEQAERQMAAAAPAPKSKLEPPAPPAPPAAPAAAPAPSIAPKGSGVVRVGVVKIKDLSGQFLPTDNLRINLMSEITRHGLEAVPLDTDAPHHVVLDEAKAKQCDYVLYTDANKIAEPGAAIARTALPAGVTLEGDKYKALLDMTLWKLGKALPEPKDFPIAEDADQFAVNAVMEAFEKEAEKVADQVKKDAAARRAPPAKAAAKPATPVKKK